MFRSGGRRHVEIITLRRVGKQGNGEQFPLNVNVVWFT
jgi:hypothetical protein